MRKHTPGPWIDFTDQGKTLAILPAMRPGSICRMGDAGTNGDARLIAAAPDLFEALESATAELERLSSVVCPDVDAPLVGEVVARARAALAKAKGGDK